MERKEYGVVVVQITSENYVEKFSYLTNFFSELIVEIESSRATEKYAKVIKLSFQYYFVFRFCQAHIYHDFR